MDIVKVAVGFIVIAVVFIIIITSCGVEPKKIEPITIYEGEYPGSIDEVIFFRIDGMPCVYIFNDSVEEQSAGLSCDWSKFNGN